MALSAIELLKKYLSNTTEEQVAVWVNHVIEACLGELVYEDPCPKGSSIIKGHPNYYVCVFVHDFLLQFLWIMLTINEEAQGLINDKLHCQPCWNIPQESTQVFNCSWTTLWACCSHSCCCMWSCSFWISTTNQTSLQSVRTSCSRFQHRQISPA